MCPSICLSIRSSERYGTHVYAPAALIHTNRSLIETSCVDVHMSYLFKTQADDGLKMGSGRARQARELPVFCRTYISATAAQIHTKSCFVEASPRVVVRSFIYSILEQVMDCPGVALGTPWAEVLSELTVASAGYHASLMPCWLIYHTCLQ